MLFTGNPELKVDTMERQVRRLKELYEQLKETGYVGGGGNGEKVMVTKDGGGREEEGEGITQ